jgi:branched-chain amino acid aminotransferase
VGRDRIKGTQIDRANKVMKIYFNNSLRDDLSLPATGGGWLLGDGAFESLRTYSGKPYALERHLDRLEQTLSELKINAPSRAQLIQGVKEIIAANPASPFGRLRITVFGDGNWMVTHIKYKPEDRFLKLCLSPIKRYSQDLTSGIKTISYQASAAALREAAQGGFDDAIFVNERGEVMESALANLLWLKDGQWFTPELSSGCLPGVIRALLIENFGVIQAPLLGEELESVDGLALTSSVREIIGVQAFEGHLYSNSKMVNELTAAFHSWILGNLEQ